MRKCGDCQLCCVLLPVADGANIITSDGRTLQMPGALNKKAGQRCPHQKHGVGCKLHGTKAMPYSCSIWNCRWLVNNDTHDMQRPDRVHYVIDIMPDLVEMVRHDTGETIEMEVIQIWVDPDYPDAHRDPALRRYIDRQRKAALIRFNERDSIFLAPPSLTGEGWYERDSKASPEMKQTRINKLVDRLAYTVEFEGEPSATGMTKTVLRSPDGQTIEIATKPHT
jgi:hypothetical protein